MDWRPLAVVAPISMFMGGCEDFAYMYDSFEMDGYELIGWDWEPADEADELFNEMESQFSDGREPIYKRLYFRTDNSAIAHVDYRSDHPGVGEEHYRMLLRRNEDGFWHVSGSGRLWRCEPEGWFRRQRHEQTPGACLS